MYSFVNDYSEGAHKAILKRLCETNMVQTSGYGTDEFCEGAKAKIRAVCGVPDADVYFISGGTQTNQIVIAATLRIYEGVIAAQSGHINVHESGAVEYTGHKVLPVPQYGGKLKADDVRALIDGFYAAGNREHMVFPGMVYISHPTEYGTLYTLDELTAISETCHEHGIPLFLDGARLGYGLMSEGTDVTIQDIARLCDMFYIGGTKVGALCGEAVVFTHGAPKHFTNTIKQHGALLAKGRLLGVQFDALFTDGLYFKISRHAIEQAMRIKEIFRSHGYELFIDSPTNQQFVILSDADMQRIGEKVKFEVWEPLPDGRTVVRFAASWATTDEAIAELERIV